MTDHPYESRREFQIGTVERVHKDAWEVDVRLSRMTGSLLRRVIVLSHYLPEVHTAARQSKVLVGFLDAYQGAPVAIPLHNPIIPKADKSNYVYWSEHRGYRITIKEPGHPSEDQVGELEIRSEKGGRLLQLRILEEDGVIRLDTPKTSVVLHDDDSSITINADEAVTVNCKNATVNAGQNVAVNAGVSCKITTPVFTVNE